MAEESTIKNFVIQPNRGNLYSDDGSLLATSVTRYDIRFDAVTVSVKNFEAMNSISRIAFKIIREAVFVLSKCTA